MDAKIRFEGIYTKELLCTLRSRVEDMRNQVHLLSAFALFLLITYLFAAEYVPSKQFVINLVVMLVCAVLPDILEPPTSRWHRAFFHSKRCLKCVLVLAIVGWAIGMQSGNYTLLFAALGYLVHLLEDATTKAGLPR